MPMLVMTLAQIAAVETGPFSEQVGEHDGGGHTYAGLVALARRGQQTVDVLGDDDCAPYALPRQRNRRLIEGAILCRDE